MLASLHGELCRAGVEDILDLRAALEAEPDRRAGRRIPRGVERHGQLEYSHAVAFPEQVQRFVDAFGRPSVHVVLLDDIRADATTVTTEVQRFLGLEPREDLPLVWANAGRAVKIARVQRFARQPGRARALTRRLVPAGMRPRVARTVVRTVERVNLTPSTRPAVPADLDAELRERYRAQVERLATIIGRDLSSWTEPRRPQPSNV